jgi:hypothetical protein
MVTTYYVGVSDAAVISIFFSAETELVLLVYPLRSKQSAYVCVVVFYRNRCLVMDGRSDTDIPAFRPHATLLPP